MTAQSAAQPVAVLKRSTNWRALRVAIGFGYLACEIVILIAGWPLGRIPALAGNVVFASLGVAAAVMAYKNALSFDRGQTARRAWMFVALMPLADSIAYTAYTMPAYLGSQARNGVLIGAATALLSVSRILAAAAFFSMVGVYLRTGLALRLKGRDYFAMALVTVMEVMALLYARSGAQASGGPKLGRIVLLTAIPMVIALVPCSVFGVVIWRYTTQMGGGLIAKAWRAILLYGVAWLAYVTLNAMVAYHFHISQGTPVPTSQFIIVVLTTWFLKGSEYLAFLGASYQYEACKSSPDFAEDIDALAGS